ncbi:hypothetical protein NUW54_g5357 [Trametes sanguinea]|uniref:Uncharacterized protein n=1 Tax=Trametes sanguinea TaxID=158606 RepID=A0ACC1PXE8_9APHY|nr:hypothetical protein NUW54_g5357 [Trametes sanguinea]
MLEPEVQNSHFHDMELCQLLHALDQPMGEPVKKAVRKAVRARVKKLGMKYDNESIKAYRKSYHDHDPSVHLVAALSGAPRSRTGTQLGTNQEPPEWAKELIQGLIRMNTRFDELAPKIEKVVRSSRGGSYVTEGRSYANDPHHHHHHYPTSEMNGYPPSQSMDIHQHPTGEESMYQTGETEMIRDSTHLHTLPGSMHHHDGSMHGAIREEEVYEDDDDRHYGTTDGDTRGVESEYAQDRENSPGQEYLEQELYRTQPQARAAGNVGGVDARRGKQVYSPSAASSRLPTPPKVNYALWFLHGLVQTALDDSRHSDERRLFTYSRLPSRSRPSLSARCLPTMVRVSVLNDCLNNIVNAERRGKRQVLVRPSSKVIVKFLSVMQRHGYIGEFEIVDDHRSGKIVIQLNGRLNKTGVISPRYNVQVNQIEAWVNLLLPARGFGIIILTTSSGILDHEEARRKNVGGKLLGYVY